MWGVAALLHAVSDALAARFSACTVRGELSGFTRAASGHCYFSLKDAEGDGGSIRCAMFRRAAGLVGFRPAEGQLVELRGRIAVYEPRGELQFVVESMQLAGDGALYEQFLRLKAKLESEGLFDPSLQQPLPNFPRRVGVVTSLGAAALHDVVTALARRAPQVEVIVYPSLVQGADAPASLVEAIGRAGTRAEVDVLIVCRGGGSLQDLWAFNDERVVRAVAHCPLPVVCGVGHETDVTLCDFAADLRAPTPTAAAEIVAPARAALIGQLAQWAARSQRRMDQLLDQHAQRLDRAALRLRRPAEAVALQSHRLDALSHRLAAGLSRTTERQRQRQRDAALRLGRSMRAALALQAQRLRADDARLQALDPRRVLSRGFAWVTDAQGVPMTSVAQVSTGQAMRAVLADGEVRATVDGIEARPRDGGSG